MVGILNIPACYVCGKALSDSNYQKTANGQGLYWANPSISRFTDVKLGFCGPEHSTKWHVGQIEACKDVTPET